MMDTMHNNRNKPHCLGPDELMGGKADLYTNLFDNLIKKLE